MTMAAPVSQAAVVTQGDVHDQWVATIVTAADVVDVLPLEQVVSGSVVPGAPVVFVASATFWAWYTTGGRDQVSERHVVVVLDGDPSAQEVADLFTAGVHDVVSAADVTTESVTFLLTVAAAKAASAPPRRTHVGGVLSRREMIHFVKQTPVTSDTGVLIVDVDHFQSLTNVFGYVAAEELMDVLAVRLRDAVRSTDVVALFGVDMFAVVVHATTQQELFALSQRIREALSSAVSINDSSIAVTVSVGAVVATCNDRLLSALGDAQRTVMVAKRAGGNRVVFHSPMVDLASRTQSELIVELCAATSESMDEFSLHFQPIVSTKTGAVVAAEVLLRWNHPVRGLIPAGVFIDAAGQAGVVPILDAWVVKAVVAVLASWESDPSMSAIALHVNVSTHLLSVTELSATLDQILAAVTEHGVGDQRLVIELADGSAALESAQVSAQLFALRRAGVRIALNDLSPSHSSWMKAGQLPVDVVKVKNPSPDAGEAVAMVVALAASLGAIVIAEGVESARQAAMVASAGVPFAQGYFYASPSPEAPGESTPAAA